jgi:hypothetical protein
MSSNYRFHRAVLASAVLGSALLALGPAAPAAAARTCVFEWAVPGQYEISGNFRGQSQTVMARLTSNCRVTIGLPGVFTGGVVRKSGGCLTFPFKVQDERQTFTARWCGSVGTVPWEGRDVQATIKRRQDRSNTGSR